MAASVYDRLEFPDPPPDRPYVFVNMVATIDGKITTGERGEPVNDLGSAVDHATMHALEEAADGMMIGAGTLRATPRINVPRHVARFCVTGSGRVDFGHNYFQDAPERAWVVTTEEAEATGPAIRAGSGSLDLRAALSAIRGLGIQRLLCEGGSDLNASLMREELVDELFLTIAPKIRLGRDVPTIADGEALKREDVQRFQLVSAIPVDDEVFLRYRRHR
jgi:riboflavin biosynthesis pyrimidine reductase